MDLWKDGDGSRYVRRLYDAQHHLIAAEWKNGEDKANSRREGHGAWYGAILRSIFSGIRTFLRSRLQLWKMAHRGFASSTAAMS